MKWHDLVHENEITWNVQKQTRTGTQNIKVYIPCPNSGLNISQST